jgi:uncharacterized protein YjdB
MMNIRRTGVLAALCMITFTAIACGNSSTSATTASSLTVTGAAPAVGATAQFSATATMSDGTTQDVTSQAAWTSSNGSIATVSSTGVVTGLGAGPVTVTASYQTISASDAIVLAP